MLAQGSALFLDELAGVLAGGPSSQWTCLSQKQDIRHSN